MINSKKSIINVVVIITFLSLISKVFGIVRESVFAAYFGVSMESDAYSAAFTVYDCVYALFFAYVSATYIPVYQKAEAEKSAGLSFTNNIISVVTCFAILVGFVFFLLAPILIRIIGPGLSGETQLLGVRLVRIFMMALPFFGLMMILPAYLNANRKFVVSQTNGLILDGCFIAIIVLSAGYVGVTSASAAIVVSCIAQSIIFFIAARRIGFRINPILHLKETYTRKTFKIARPVFISSISYMAVIFVDRIMASFFETGSMASLVYANRLIAFSITLVTTAVITIFFPILSEFGAKKQFDRIQQYVRKCSDIFIFTMVPISVITIILCREIVSIIYARGSFGAEATYITSRFLAWYAVGSLGVVFTSFMTKIFHSIQDTKTPMHIGLFMIPSDIVFSYVLGSIMGVQGLALAGSLNNLLWGALSVYFLRTKINQSKFAIPFDQLALSILCSLIAAIPLYLFYNFTEIKSHILIFISGTGLFGLLYIALAMLFRMSAARELLNIAKSYAFKK